MKTINYKRLPKGLTLSTGLNVLNTTDFKDMKNDLNKEAKRIISHSSTGKECNYMGVDFRYYGMGIYGYSEDVVASGCEYKKGNNELFLHIVPTVENVAKYLHFIRERM